MTLALSLTALFISWIWIDYFRRIDIYERESPLCFIITFILGALSPILVFIIDPLVSSLSLELNGAFVNDFIYCFLRIGVIEEFAKFVPFLIMFSLFRKEINEPIDYFVYLSLSALGFAATENILYFVNHGPDIIIIRSILATMCHIFCTSLIAWGFINFQYRKTKNRWASLASWFIMAALGHGFYDFWLVYEGTMGAGVAITILYFFFTISVFATILNNALNNSGFFSFKKVIDSGAMVKRMLFYYIIVFIAQIILTAFSEGSAFASKGIAGTYLTSGFIVSITVIRLSRFRLIPGRWNRIRIQLPFRIMFENFPFIKILVRGDSFNEVHVNAFYQENFLICYFSKRTADTVLCHNAYIEKKIFLSGDETYYLARIYSDADTGSYHHRLLKPKTTDITLKKNRYPIVAVLNFDDVTDFESPRHNAASFIFESWAFMKPVNEA